MSSELFTVDMMMGYLQLVQTQEQRGSKLYLGGYAIHRDRAGHEIRRTANEWNCVLDCGSEKEASRLAKLRHTPSEQP